MNKFVVFPCIDQDESEGYNGPVVTMASTSNVQFMLFFPIAEEYANLINLLLKDEKNTKANLQLLAVYQTMLHSWKAGDRYLSGIVMDMKYDDALEEDVISPTLIICDAMGNVDAVLEVNFVHAVMLAAMERKEMIVSNDLLNQLLPLSDEEEEEIEKYAEEEEENPFPVDKQILDIAKSIINGKQDIENNEIEKKEENPKNPTKSPKSTRTPKTRKPKKDDK